MERIATDGRESSFGVRRALSMDVQIGKSRRLRRGWGAGFVIAMSVGLWATITSTSGFEMVVDTEIRAARCYGMLSEERKWRRTVELSGKRDDWTKRGTRRIGSCSIISRAKGCQWVVGLYRGATDGWQQSVLNRMSIYHESTIGSNWASEKAKRIWRSEDRGCWKRW